MHITVRRLLVSINLVSTTIIVGGLALWGLGKGRWGIWESLYMSVISVSTVGFGELPNIDQVRGARAVTVATIIFGLGAVAFFQSALTALLLEDVIGNAWRRNRMKKAIEEITNHVVVAGVGSTGKHVIEELIATRTPFVAIDRHHDVLKRVSEEICDGNMLFIAGDATEDHTLTDAGVQRASGVIAALTHDRDNLFVTLSARALNARARIVTKVVETEALRKMIRAGANATVSPNIIGGRRLAGELIRPDVVEFLDQMMRDRDKNLRFEEVAIPRESSFVGKMLRDVPIRKDANVLVVAVRNQERTFQYNPGPDHKIEPGTVLIVLGEAGQMPALRSLIEGSVAR